MISASFSNSAAGLPASFCRFGVMLVTRVKVRESSASRAMLLGTAYGQENVHFCTFSMFCRQGKPQDSRLNTRSCPPAWSFTWVKRFELFLNISYLKVCWKCAYGETTITHHLISAFCKVLCFFKRNLLCFSFPPFCVGYFSVSLSIITCCF